MASLHITHRAARDLDEIAEYSQRQWGRRRAARYLDAVDGALALLKEHPGLLQSKPEISKRLEFYVSGEHVLVFKQVNGRLYLTTVMHSRMNLDRRIPELEPTLESEVEAMHQKLHQPGQP